MKTRSIIPLVLALSAAASQAALFTFDSDATVNASTGLPLDTAASFHFGTTEDIYDIDGFDTGMDRWIVDPAPIDPLTEDPQTTGYGSAGSALNAVNQTMLIVFSSSFNIISFSLFMDDSAFGTDFLPVEFYDENDVLITTLDALGSTPGYEITGTGIDGVKTIVLPGGAMYDNLTLTGSAVPEPSSLALLGLGGLTLAARRRRRAA